MKVDLSAYKSRLNSIYRSICEQEEALQFKSGTSKQIAALGLLKKAVESMIDFCCSLEKKD